jgi:hypothetical protein
MCKNLSFFNNVAAPFVPAMLVTIIYSLSFKSPLNIK